MASHSVNQLKNIPKHRNEEDKQRKHKRTTYAWDIVNHGTKTCSLANSTLKDKAQNTKEDHKLSGLL